MITKVISGGQTGADQGGLIAARQLWIETGGWAPKGWRTEAGPAPWLADYGLTQSIYATYSRRTRDNVMDSDGTVVFGKRSIGSEMTMQYCLKMSKPVWWVQEGKLRRTMDDEVVALVNWVETNNIRILNVAGNRESVLPGIGALVKEFMLIFLSHYVTDVR